MSIELASQEHDINFSDISWRYLNLYVGELGKDEWNRHLSTLMGRLKRKMDPQLAKDQLRKIVSCAILLPAIDRTKIPDNPENLLFWCSSYDQFNQRDWVAEFAEVVKRDDEITDWRNTCQRLGVIHPIVYAPYSRQAYNWLFRWAEDSGDMTDANKAVLEQRFERLVLTYGGLVVCSLFQKEEGKIKRKVLNWRTGYFFERLIFDVYSLDQVIKIKKQELSKTNPTLVKQIKS